MRWTVLTVRSPADPSRHRVAVWRELRRVGALLLGQGVWAIPGHARLHHHAGPGGHRPRECHPSRSATRLAARPPSMLVTANTIF